MRCSPTEVHAAVVLGSAGVFQNVSRKRTAPLHKHGMANRRYYNSTGYRVVHIVRAKNRGGGGVVAVGKNVTWYPPKGADNSCVGAASKGFVAKVAVAHALCPPDAPKSCFLGGFIFLKIKICFGR